MTFTVSNNPFANYTLSIAAQYQDTKEGIELAQKKPGRKIHHSMESMLKECVFLGATRFGTNFIA